MTIIDFKNLLKQKKGTMFSIVFVALMLTLLVSLIGPLKYTSSSKVLVVQKNPATSDSYALSRSNEYLGNLFSQVVYSGSFFNSVLNSDRYDIDKSYFKGDYGEKLEIWNKTISTKTIADTGIIEIYVYHPNPNQAMIISMAVNDVLINDNSNYQGGEGIRISVLNQAVVSDYPNKPNILYSLVFALLISFLLSIIYIYLYPERKYDISLLPKSDGKSKMKKEERKRYKQMKKTEKEEKKRQREEGRMKRELDKRNRSIDNYKREIEKRDAISGREKLNISRNGLDIKASSVNSHRQSVPVERGVKEEGNNNDYQDREDNEQRENNKHREDNEHYNQARTSNFRDELANDFKRNDLREQDNKNRERNEDRTNGEGRTRNEDKTKEELFEKDVFEPKGDMRGLFK